MSRANVEIVRRQSDAYARGDYEEALSIFDPPVVYDISGTAPEGACITALRASKDEPSKRSR